MPMKLLAHLAIVTTLAGCAAGKTGNQIYRGGLVGQRVVGNEVGVSVTNVWNQADALGLAERHCRQFGRAARFTQMHGNVASFDCVPV